MDYREDKDKEDSYLERLANDAMPKNYDEYPEWLDQCYEEEYDERRKKGRPSDWVDDIYNDGNYGGEG